LPKLKTPKPVKRRGKKDAEELKEHGSKNGSWDSDKSNQESKAGVKKLRKKTTSGLVRVL
jgi:hypothetical protein